MVRDAMAGKIFQKLKGKVDGPGALRQGRNGRDGTAGKIGPDGMTGKIGQKRNDRED